MQEKDNKKLSAQLNSQALMTEKAWKIILCDWKCLEGTLAILCPDLKTNKKILSKYADNVSHSTDVKNCIYFPGMQQLYFFFFFCCSEISRNSKNLIIVFAQRIYQDKGNFFFPGYANKDIPVHIPVQEYVH